MKARVSEMFLLQVTNDSGEGNFLMPCQKAKCYILTWCQWKKLRFLQYALTAAVCLACVCICRYLSPNCLLFDQPLIKETITLGTGQGKASSDKNVVEQHWERKKKVWCFLIMWTLWLWPQLVICFSSVQFSFQHSFWEINYFVCLHRTTFVINILWDPGATSMI